jgi:DNA-binding transcriptional LysR family regulator
MPGQPTDWDDLRYVLAVARGGNHSAAARRLGINPSTVFRRLAALEQRLGTRLFDRQGGRHEPTAAGSDLLAAAERIEGEMDNLERRLAGRDLRLTGSVRVTAPDDMVEHLLVEPLSAFHQAYPEIMLEMAIDNRMLSLTKREADIALRPTSQPPETLVGRRVARVRSGVYGRGDRFAQASGMIPEADLGAHPWVGWEEGGLPSSLGRWMGQHVPAESLVYRANSMLNIFAACRAGIGLALLPCFLGDRAGELRRVTPLPEDLSVDLWILTHPDIRRTARIRAVTDFLYRALSAERARLDGSAGG